MHEHIFMNELSFDLKFCINMVFGGHLHNLGGEFAHFRNIYMYVSKWSQTLEGFEERA